VALFSIFATLPLIELKVMGVGMGAAILIDATVVRGVLLPAVLSLLGDRAWRLRRHPQPRQVNQPVAAGRPSSYGRQLAGSPSQLHMEESDQ